MTEQVKQYPFNYDGEDDNEILKKGLPEEVTLTAVDSGFEMSDELAERFCEEVNEFLADKYGFLNEGWAYEIKLSGIMWERD